MRYEFCVMMVGIMLRVSSAANGVSAWANRRGYAWLGRARKCQGGVAQ